MIVTVTLIKGDNMNEKEIRDAIKKALVVTTQQDEAISFYRDDPKFYQGLSMSSECFVDGYFVGYKAAQDKMKMQQRDMVCEIVDRLFHSYASYYRTEAEQEAGEMVDNWELKK
jgi:hypothetical protein